MRGEGSREKRGMTRGVGGLAGVVGGRGGWGGCRLAEIKGREKKGVGWLGGWGGGGVFEMFCSFHRQILKVQLLTQQYSASSHSDK